MEKNCIKGISPMDMGAYIEGYKAFLNESKTEREAVKTVRDIAQQAGFLPLSYYLSRGKGLVQGDKVYVEKNSKAIALFVVGQRPLQEGLHLICAHNDSPRLDIRQQPLLEKDGMVLLKTHYYGGIKKYQWVTLPLSLHGTVVKKGGEKLHISIGEREEEPVFYISDLPKHLSAQQAKTTLGEGIGGEDLNPIAASGEGSVTDTLLKLLQDRYGIGQKDLISAELELVPAGKARDAGFDSSMIVAYGQDDKVCGYGALMALLEMSNPCYSCGVLLVDKEEVGSQGATGMQSFLMENMVQALLDADHNNAGAAKVLERSKMLSADVVVGFDPNYPEAYEKNNAARIGQGVALIKYAGHMGKKDCNDASAEYIAYLRDIWDEAEVSWQTGEFGRIDLGGGGTIAPFAARYGMEVADCGTPLISMHAPFELVSKVDAYETYGAYRAFFNTDKDISPYR